MIEGEALALACAEAAADKKAEDIVILDLRGISSFTDFFIVCSASSDPQLKAVASSIRESVREKGTRPLNEEGGPTSQWVVIDFGEAIVHLFNSEKREFYNLESLWKDAPRLRFEPSVPGSRA